MSRERIGKSDPDDPWSEGGLPVPRPPRRLPVPAPAHENLPPYPAHPDHPGPEADELKLNLFNYWRIVVKRRWLIAAIAGTVVTIGLIMTMMTTSIYTASTTLQIDREAAKVVAQGEEGLQPSGGDAEFYQTQYELLKSRSLAERVVLALNLTENPLLFGEKAPGLWTRLWRRFAGEPAPSRPDFAARKNAAIGFVLGGLAVEPVRLSRLVRLSFRSPNPELSQQVVNGIADNFIAASLERKFDASSYARTFLEERLQQLKVKLEESERNIVNYAQKQQIVNVGERQSLVGADLEAVAAKLTSVRSERTRNEQLWLQAQSTEGLGLPQFLESSIIQTLRDTRAQLAGDYEQKLNLFKPAYPEMVDLRDRIAEIDAQIQAEIENIKNSLRAAYETSLKEEQSLTKQLEVLKTQALDLRARTIQYDILQREVDTNRSLYDGLLQRYKEIGVAGGVGTNNVSVVDRAEVPTTRSSPSLRKNLQMALMLGLFAGVLCAFGLEYIDDTLKTPEDVETKLGLPVLGVIPKFEKGETTSKLLDDTRSPVSEAYRSLATALQFSTDTGVPKSVLITSARPGEGKSTTAYALARNLAQLGGRILLIDADMRNPSLHTELGDDNGAGLSSYLAGAARPPELLRETSTPNLAFLPAGPQPPNPAQLLSGPKMPSFLSVAMNIYDVVIVDGPPVMGLADAPILANMASATLLVTSAGETRQGLVKQAIKRLHFARAEIIGVLLTKFDARRAGYTYGYGYGTDYYGYGNEPPKLTQNKDAEAA